MNNKTSQGVVFQQLKSDINFQAIATRQNTTVYEYQLSDGSIGHCYIALTETNRWMKPTGEIVGVLKLIRTFEPETKGHHEIKRYYRGRNGKRAAVNLGQAVTQLFVNAHYDIQEKSIKGLSLYRLTISNLTDEQFNNLYKTFDLDDGEIS